MSLKIFGENGAPQKKTSFADDVVGRFRSGYQANDRPVSLSDWRVTTGDPVVADAISELLDGDKPAEWDTKSEENLEVFTKASAVEVILEGPHALRQAMILWGRNGKIIRKTDGEQILYPEDQKGQPDPQASQSFAERKAAGNEGTGAIPQIELYFRLAENPDLGIFKFQSGSWSFASDLAYNNTEDELVDYLADSKGNKVSATLTLEQVEFTAKNGPRAGQLVQYTKPVLTLNGPVA